MNKRFKKIIAILEKSYPNQRSFLHFKTPFESLIATILSAQCSDARVNIVTKKLFPIANTPEKILKLGEKKLIFFIKSTGFYRAKAQNIIGAAKTLLKKYKGRVPASLEALQTLPGVGRKTASVVLCQAFGIPAFPVDRHVFRVANRLSIARAKTPEKTDQQLRKNIPQKYWIPLHLQLISHGRTLCRPKPLCGRCPLLPYCSEGKQRHRTGNYKKWIHTPDSQSRFFMVK